MWPLKSRNVKCVECGYLVVHENDYHECLRGQINKFKNRSGIRNEKLENAKNIPRFCEYYFKKMPGLTPEQHLEHQLYKGPGVNLSRWALFWSVLAVLVSIGALIVSFLNHKGN